MCRERVKQKRVFIQSKKAERSEAKRPQNPGGKTKQSGSKKNAFELKFNAIWSNFSFFFKKRFEKKAFEFKFNAILSTDVHECGGPGVLDYDINIEAFDYDINLSARPELGNLAQDDLYD